MKVFKIDILKAIIVVGTFALALAFAGNDLVNFIGVPIAAWQSYDIYISSGVPANELIMSGLAGSVETPEFLLILAGAIMVITLWFSSKARSVVDTGVNLSRQGEGVEKFSPNFLSRTIVRYSVLLGAALETVIPKKVQETIDSKFEKVEIPKSKKLEANSLSAAKAIRGAYVS